MHDTSRARRITNFVKTYNEKQTHLWKVSVQYQMYRIREDINRLHIMKDSLCRIFDAHEELKNCTKAFIDTERLNNVDVNRVFFNIKKEQYIKLDNLTHSRLVLTLENKQQAATLFKEYIEEFEEAYRAKGSTLILLRMSAVEDLRCMFRAYTLFSSLRMMPPIVTDDIFVIYMHLIFSSGIVQVNELVISTALDTLLSSSS